MRPSATVALALAAALLLWVGALALAFRLIEEMDEALLTIGTEDE